MLIEDATPERILEFIKLAISELEAGNMIIAKGILEEVREGFMWMCAHKKAEEI